MIAERERNIYKKKFSQFVDPVNTWFYFSTKFLYYDRRRKG